MKGIAIFLSSLSVLISVIFTQTGCVSTVENDGPLQEADNNSNSSEQPPFPEPQNSNESLTTPPTSETVMNDPPADETAMVAPSTDETTLTPPPAAETVMDAPPVGETAMDPPSTAETAMDDPPADETAMDAPPVGETAMVAPSTDETTLTPPPAAETAMDDPPADETTLTAPPAAETAMSDPPASETAMDTLPSVETVMDALPVGETAMDPPSTAETTMDDPPADETALTAPPAAETTMDDPPADETTLTAPPAAETAMAAPPVAETAMSDPPADETIMDAPSAAVKHDSGDFSPTLEGWGWVFRSDLSTPGNWRFLNRERTGNATKFNFHFDEEGTWSFVFDQQNLSEGGRRREIRKLRYSKDLGVEIIDSGELDSQVLQTEQYTEVQNDLESVPEESAAVDSRTTEALIQEAVRNGSAVEIASLLPQYMENDVDPDVLDSVVNTLDDADGYEEEVFSALILLSDFSSHQKNAEWLFRLASFLAKPGKKRSLSQAVVFYQKVIDSWPLSRWRELAEERLIWLKRHYFRSQ